MKKLSSLLLAFLLGCTAPLFAAGIQCQTVTKGTQQCTTSTTKTYGINNMPYALCSKTLCTLDKKHPNKARCLCPIYQKKGWTALSFSPTPYQQAKPSWNKANSTMKVQSNFSLANTANSKGSQLITCQSKQPKPWANCYGIRCTVNSHTTATCVCPVVKSTNFTIDGPGNKSKCHPRSGHIWSGTSPKGKKASDAFIQALYKQLYPKAPVNH